MMIVRQFFNFYINSSIHVALAVVSLTFITLLELNSIDHNALLFFVFYASIAGYNFVKYSSLLSKLTYKFINRLGAIFGFTLVCFVLMCVYALKLNFYTLLITLLLCVITIFYTIPVWRIKFSFNVINLRTVSGLKIYLIAIVWTGVTVFLPFLESGSVLNNTIVITSFQRFVIVLVLMLPFEIRDLRYDHVHLATIPQKYGVKHTKLIGFFLTLLYFLLEFFKATSNTNKILIQGIMAVLIIGFLLGSKKNQNKYYCSFWVESLPIFWLFLLLIFN